MGNKINLIVWVQSDLFFLLSKNERRNFIYARNSSCGDASNRTNGYYITRVIWIKEDWLLECDNWWSYHQEPMTPNETWRMQYKENIWHPVMIWDVMYYIRKKYWNNHSWFHTDRFKLIDLRSKEREPIEWQYDECINFVHSLIPKL